MSVDSLEHMPVGKWQFDNKVTECFDDMLARSIPQLHIMRELVTDIALRHIQPYSTTLDLGCSNGGALRPIIKSNDDVTCQFVGVDTSQPMVDSARLNLKNSIEAGSLSLLKKY